MRIRWEKPNHGIFAVLFRITTVCLGLSLVNAAWVSALGTSLSSPVSVQQDELRHRAEAWIDRGDAYLEGHEDAQAALMCFQASLDLAHQLNDGSLVSRSLWKLANLYLLYFQGYEKALNLAEKSLSAARMAGDRRQESWALDQVGNAYFALGHYAKALENFQDSLKRMKELGDRFGEATALKDVGITYRLLGQYDEAIGFLQESLEIFRQLGGSDYAASALQNLGMAYSSLGDYRQTFESYEQALRIAQEDQNNKLIYGALARMGFLNLELNNPDQALDYLQHALAVGEKWRPSGADTWLLRGVAGALNELGQVEAAVEVCQRSLSIDRRRRDEVGIASDFWGLGQLYLDRDPRTARDYLNLALDIFQKQDFQLLWGLYAALAQTYRRQGDLDRAIDYYQKAMERLEWVRGQVASQDHRALFLGKHHRLYQELVETLMEQSQRVPEAGYTARAFHILERSKARVMVEAIVESRLNLGRQLDPHLRQSEQELNARIADLQKSLIKSATKAERQRIREQLNSAEQELDRLILEIKRQNARYAAVRYPDPLSLERAQALLDGRTALLSYLIAEDHVFSFILTASAFHAQRLEVAPKVLVGRVQNYVELMARDDGTAVQYIGCRLYADLVAPLRKQLPAEISQLIIIPDGVLHYLPFESLIADSSGHLPDARVHQLPGRQGSSSSRYLIEDFTISYAPSATVLSELEMSRIRPGSTERDDLLVFAQPTVSTAPVAALQRAFERTRSFYDDEGFKVGAIPYSRAEAKAIVRYATRSTLLVGDEASESRVKTDRLDRFRVIHFATHGLISESMPTLSALLLASGSSDREDGFLQTREIYDLKLKSDLVVLSACQTGRGRILAGEGVQGLAQAFFYAGAQSVVASLWNANDQSTAKLMAAFYRYLTEGQSKAQALRSAKLDLLRSVATSRPRYWAPFILIGEGHRPVTLSGISTWFEYRRLIMWGILLLGTLSIGYLARTRAIRGLRRK